MIEAYLRPTYQRFFLDPLAHLLKRLSFVTPNGVTSTAVVLGVMAAMAFVFHASLIAVLLLLLSGFCDSLDGTLARLSDRSSHFGAAWDIVGDRIVEFAVMAAFYFYNPAVNALGVLMMLGASYLCITTFLVVGIFTENASQKGFHYSVGLMERLEAFLFFGVMMLFPHMIPWLAWCYAILVFYTALNRLLEFKRQW